MSVSTLAKILSCFFRIIHHSKTGKSNSLESKKLLLERRFWPTSLSQEVFWLSSHWHVFLSQRKWLYFQVIVMTCSVFVCLCVCACVEKLKKITLFQIWSHKMFLSSTSCQNFVLQKAVYVSGKFLNFDTFQPTVYWAVSNDFWQLEKGKVLLQTKPNYTLDWGQCAAAVQ